MKMNSLRYSLPLLFAVSLVGCATNPAVDWNSRVGHYTYADAVRELGQPNREIHTSNGSTEFKWFAQPVPGNLNVAVGGLSNPNPAGNRRFNGPNSGSGTSSFAFHNRYLQLTFDSNGVLTAWTKNY